MDLYSGLPWSVDEEINAKGIKDGDVETAIKVLEEAGWVLLFHLWIVSCLLLPFNFSRWKGLFLEARRKNPTSK